MEEPLLNCLPCLLIAGGYCLVDMPLVSQLKVSCNSPTHHKDILEVQMITECFNYLNNAKNII